MEQQGRGGGPVAGGTPGMTNREEISKRDLSEPRRRLLELMQEVNYGRIENLEVRDGEPVFDPPPRIIRKIKIAAANGPRPEIKSHDFTLRKEVVEFFEHLETLGAGVVRCIEIKNGLPFSMDIEATVQG